MERMGKNGKRHIYASLNLRQWGDKVVDVISAGKTGYEQYEKK